MAQNDTDDLRAAPRGLKAGNGSYLFELAHVNHIEAGPDYSTAAGSLVECERSMIGLMRMPRGTGARLHSHPNEQWVYMLEGELDVEVDGIKFTATPGSLVYFPPNSVHGTMASTERDAVFLTGKDLSHGIWGKPVDNTVKGPAYRGDFTPNKA